MGGKLFAVIVIVIALASAVPILNHTFLGASVKPPEDISTHGAEIDRQLDETMLEAGLSFLAPNWYSVSLCGNLVEGRTVR
jgi:hypothetical protein